MIIAIVKNIRINLFKFIAIYKRKQNPLSFNGVNVECIKHKKICSLYATDANPSLLSVIPYNYRMGKIIVFGDSIAYGKWDHQGGWVNRLRQYIDKQYNIGKGGNVQVYNLGIPGEVAPRLAERFSEELSYRIEKDAHNLVLIAVGVNDSCPNNWMTQQQTPPEEFSRAITQMVESARTQQCRVCAIGLTPVDPAKSKGLAFSNEEVQKYDHYLQETCDAIKTDKIEMYNNLINTRYADTLVDSVHPSSDGHEALYHLVLNFLQSKQLLQWCSEN
jgi:lysophospholipase L1-like esterase